MRETFKDRNHVNMTSLMAKVLHIPETFSRYKFESILFFFKEGNFSTKMGHITLLEKYRT